MSQEEKQQDVVEEKAAAGEATYTGSLLVTTYISHNHALGCIVSPLAPSHFVIDILAPCSVNCRSCEAKKKEDDG